MGAAGIQIEKNAFGCLPIQRISKEVAVQLLRRAYDGRIDFYDTGRAYTDGEEKLGAAFSHMRDKVIIASKTTAQTGRQFEADLHTSLRQLKTNYIDIYQFHNPTFCPRPGGADGLYDAALNAQKAGKIRHISITNHRIRVAHEAIDSKLFATLQFPFSYLSGDVEQELIAKCRKQSMAFPGMKCMAGGLLSNGLACAAFMDTQPSVIPLWGIQRECELDDFLLSVRRGVAMTEAYQTMIAQDQTELSHNFCRGCGCCMPCPAGIKIYDCARMPLHLHRTPPEKWITPEWQESMHRIKHCINCGSCMKKCPFGLEIPNLLRENYQKYWSYLKEHNHPIV